MSSWGAMIENDQGKRIIEENEVGYVFLKKMTATVTSGDVYIDTGLRIEDAPMIFFNTDNYNPSGGKSSLCGIRTITSYDGNKTNVRCLATGRNNSTPITFNIYIFVPSHYMSAGKWGMQIMDDSGKVVFHSGRTNLVINDRINCFTGRLQSYPYTPAACGVVYQISSNLMGYFTALTIIGMKTNSLGWPANSFGGLGVASRSNRSARALVVNTKTYALVIDVARYAGIPNARVEDVAEEYRDSYREGLKSAEEFHSSPYSLAKVNDKELLVIAEEGDKPDCDLV